LLQLLLLRELLKLLLQRLLLNLLLKRLLLRELLRIDLHRVGCKGKQPAADTAGDLSNLATQPRLSEDTTDAATNQPTHRCAEHCPEKSLRQ